MPATLPSGAEPTVAFISGVTSAATVAGTSYGTWNGNSPATYNTTQSLAYKWGDTTLFPEGSGARISYWFDTPSAWTQAEQNAFLAGLHLWEALANLHFIPTESAATDADYQIFRNNTGVANTGASFYARDNREQHIRFSSFPWHGWDHD